MEFINNQVCNVVSRAEAEKILKDMKEIADLYDFATISDLKYACGIESNYTDNHFGWTGYDLNSACIARVVSHNYPENKWVVIFPKARSRCSMIKDVQLRKTNPSASDIWHHIREKDFSKEYTYTILGRPGPTGKTTLCSRLRRLGYEAFEITEEVLPYCRFESDRNAFVVNEYEKHVIIVLNQHVR